MRYTTGTCEFSSDTPCVITLGKFDGLHRGHKKLLERVVDIAGERKFTSVMFTFEVSPYTLTRDDRHRVLLTNDERCRMLEQTDLDWLIECPFDEQMMRMEAEDFVRELLVKRLKAACLVIGPDFRFGHNRAGDADLLKRMGQEYGFSVEVLPKEMYGDREISSTLIRECILRGEMEKAADMLGYSYFFYGRIIHGRQIGRTLGLPTTNLRADENKVLPPFGVYATRSNIGDMEFGGVTNIGVKPTVQEKFVGIETHLFSCNLNLYGDMQKVELMHFQRPERKFASLEELKRQILADGKDARSVLEKLKAL